MKNVRGHREALLDDLSCRLTTDFGRGFDTTNLRKMRQFYRMFDIRDAARLDSAREAVRHEIDSVLAEGRRLFAAEYLKALPSEGTLRRELERVRMQIETRAADTLAAHDPARPRRAQRRKS